VPALAATIAGACRASVLHGAHRCQHTIELSNFLDTLDAPPRAQKRPRKPKPKSVWERLLSEESVVDPEPPKSNVVGSAALTGSADNAAAPGEAGADRRRGHPGKPLFSRERAHRASAGPCTRRRQRWSGPRVSAAGRMARRA
jgi:hypothetical protein